MSGQQVPGVGGYTVVFSHDLELLCLEKIERHCGASFLFAKIESTAYRSKVEVILGVSRSRDTHVVVQCEEQGCLQFINTS